MEEVVYTGCYNCGDFYDLKNAIPVLFKDDFARQENFEMNWLTTPKTCLNCGKIYIPVKRLTKTYKFVFEKFKSCKMDKRGI